MINERAVSIERLVPTAGHAVRRRDVLHRYSLDADGGFEIIYHFNLGNSQHMSTGGSRSGKATSFPVCLRFFFAPA